MLKTKLLVLPILLLTLTNSTLVSKVESSQSINQADQIQPKELDARAKILADYLAKYNSPLQYHAQDFIDAADTYNIDWKLVPSISGVESTFGKASYGYNAWGWGIYGNQTLNFSSWRDGIFTVSGGLKQNYINKGLTNPYSMNKVYAASPTWGTHVSFFMNDLDNFANNYNSKDSKPVSSYLMKTVSASAQIALK